ncbi:Hypothetical protein A7982_08658 [Minicystis rosea]|nr:Hypothetical protein A7982_08658 [Minicystis rosea]
MPLFLRAPLPLVAALAVGCTTPVIDDVADAAGAMTDGVVLVERTVAADGAAQTNVSAKFMRLSTPADPELAERVVGSTLDLPPAGTCRRTATDVNGKMPALGSLGAIELIDVGDVTLRTGPSVMTLAARAFPDVGDLVSGMFYTSRDATSDLPSGATYTLEGTGSAQFERFAIEAEAPAAPEDVRVGELSLGESPVIGLGEPALVRWRAATSDKGRDDVVLVDVTATSGASVRCAFADAGQASIPAWVFGTGTLGALPATATLSVHRVRERSLSVSGFDAGAVRFDLSVVGRITVANEPHSDHAAAMSAPAPQP